MTEIETIEGLKPEEYRENAVPFTELVSIDPLERFAGQGESAIIGFAGEIIDDIETQFIAEAAYLRSEANGFCGDAREDWLTAEAEVDARLDEVLAHEAAVLRQATALPRLHN